MPPRRLAPLRVVLLLALVTSVRADPAAPDVPPPWAYGFKTPPPALPAPRSTAAPAAPAAPDPTLHRLPGTDRTFTAAEIRNNFAPADWYPGDHPPMPDIVAHGKAPVVWACARCHYHPSRSARSRARP